MPGLEFSRDYTDWVLPIMKGTALIVGCRDIKPRKQIKDLQAYMPADDHPQRYFSETGAYAIRPEETKTKLFRERRYKDMLRFVFHFEHTKARWEHYYEANTTHELIKNCANFQGQIIERAAARDADLGHLDLLIFDTLRALGLSHQISQVQTQMSDADFDEHGYVVPTTVAPSGSSTAFTITRYNHNIHGPYPGGRDQPEGDLLGKILKHIILTCEENMSNRYHWHIIAAVLSLLSLVFGDLSPRKEFVTTFDDEELEDAWLKLCGLLDQNCGGYHPLWNYETCPIYSGRKKSKYNTHQCLYNDLISIWNKGGGLSSGHPFND